jgi:hypothetical protein
MRKFQPVLVLLLTVFLVSCAGTQPETARRSESAPSESGFKLRDIQELRSDLSSIPEREAASEKPLPEAGEPSRQQKVKQTSADTRSPDAVQSIPAKINTGLISATQAPEEKPELRPGQGETIKVESLLLDKADIAEVTQLFFGKDFLNMDYVLDPTLRGADQPLSRGRVHQERVPRHHQKGL